MSSENTECNSAIIYKSSKMFTKKSKSTEQMYLKNLFCPPMALIISEVSFIGGGIGFGSRPSIKPKSTWNILPKIMRITEKDGISLTIFTQQQVMQMAVTNPKNITYDTNCDIFINLRKNRNNKGFETLMIKF